MKKKIPVTVLSGYLGSRKTANITRGASIIEKMG